MPKSSTQGRSGCAHRKPTPREGLTERGERRRMRLADSPAANRESVSAAVNIRVTDPILVDDLADALRRCEYTVMQTSASALTAVPPRGPSTRIEGAEELELDLYLRVWEARHPGVRASRVHS